MRLPLIRMGSGFVALALLAGAPAMAMDADMLPPSAADAMAQAASPQAIAEYRRKLKEYQEARAAFEEEAGPIGPRSPRSEGAATPSGGSARPSRSTITC